jgi:hypothetical protein
VFDLHSYFSLSYVSIGVAIYKSFTTNFPVKKLITWKCSRHIQHLSVSDTRTTLKCVLTFNRFCFNFPFQIIAGVCFVFGICVCVRRCFIAPHSLGWMYSLGIIDSLELFVCSNTCSLLFLFVIKTTILPHESNIVSYLTALSKSNEQE